MTNSASPDQWINALSPAQLAQARMLQGTGLSGEFDGSVFAWRREGEIVAESSSHSSVADAFEDAAAKLPK